MMMVSAEVAHKRTSGRDLMYNGRAIWPEEGEVDMGPGKVLLGVMVWVTVASLAVLFAGVVPKVFYLTGPYFCLEKKPGS